MSETVETLLGLALIVGVAVLTITVGVAAAVRNHRA